MPQRLSIFPMLIVWACEDGLSIGQLVLDAKTNEIKALRQLIDLLDAKGHTVSLDAKGCQKIHRTKALPS